MSAFSNSSMLRAGFAPNCFATSSFFLASRLQTTASSALPALRMPSGMVRRLAMPPEPITPHRIFCFMRILLEAGRPRLFGVMLDDLDQPVRDLFHVGHGEGGKSKTSESMRLMPARVRHVHVGVIHTRGIGIFLRVERKTGAAKGVVLLERGFGV